MTVSITVTPVNDAPVIDGGDTAAITVPENTLAVTTVTATDVELDTVTFSVTDGADKDLFTIDNNGVLKFINAPDFEDQNHSNIYEVVVTASDGNGGFDTQTINVTVLDGAPQLAAITTAYENHLVIGSVAEGDASGVGYSILPVPSTDAARFSIDSSHWRSIILVVAKFRSAQRWQS